MKIYLAGPMRGIPHFNFPAFKTATAVLRAQGHEVFCPAEADTMRCGVDISRDNLTGDVKQAERDYGFSRREALAVDTNWICREADAIALLPEWQTSKGALAERALAEALDLKIIELPDFSVPEL